MTLSTDTRNVRSGFRVWGLTGGIAAGKSTAARFFKEAGYPVIDADQIARELSEPGGRAHGSIMQRFGTTDRVELRNRIFKDPKAKKDLEAILHPMIRAESYNRMQDIAKAFPGDPKTLVMIYEAALLVETGRYKDFEGLIVIDAPRELRKQRLMARDGLHEVMVEQILDAQASDESRRKAATLVLDNSGSLEALKKEVLEIASKLPEALG